MRQTVSTAPGQLDPVAAAVMVEALAAGELVLVPTETVYGVAARVDRPAAIARLYRAKGRAEEKPLQVLVATPEDARALAATWPDAAARLAAACWPGPLTLVVPARADLPPGVTAADGTVGLRCPAHAALGELLAAVGPLAASSANRAGEPPAATCAEAVTSLGEQVAVALDAGRAEGGVPSTVVRVTAGGWEILRAGALSPAEIAAHAEAR